MVGVADPGGTLQGLATIPRPCGSYRSGIYAP